MADAAFTPPGAGAGSADFHSTPQFPHHVGPRTWLISSGVSNMGLRLAAMLLEHGDNVVLGTMPAAYDDLYAAAMGGSGGGTGAGGSSSSSSNSSGSNGGGGGSGATTTAAGAAGAAGSSALDQPFARHDSELLRRFLLDIEEAEERDGYNATDSAANVGTSGFPGSDNDDEEMSGQQQQQQQQQEENEGRGESRGNNNNNGNGGGEDDSTTPPPSSSEPTTATPLPARRRLRPVRLDPRSAGQCQGAVATAVAAFGALDVVVCNSSEVVVGTVEELGASDETLSLVREQFEVNFFASVNCIKAAVPPMRRSGRGGHVVVITGITGHLGTPGLGAYCAAGWALEGYCDSIAYEIAPFNIKVSIVQPHLETAVLPNLIRAPPSLPQYQPASHPAPLTRNVIGGLLDRIHGIDGTTLSPSGGGGGGGGEEQRRDSSATERTSASDELRPVSKTLGSSTGVSVHEPRLPKELLDGLICETLFSVCAIGGHPSPPQRHIVGTEGVISVKEKLKTVSVELEDLVQASTAVDIVQEE